VYESLFAQNKGLLIMLARLYAGDCALDRAVSEEDLVQTGFLALVRAKQTYDPSGGRSWTSWAAWHIRREYENALCLRAGMHIQAHSGADTLDRSTSADDGAAATVGELLPDDSLPDVDAGVLLDELRRDVRAAVARLEDDDERRAVQLCQLEERSCRDASRAMGVSPRQFRRLNHRARERLFRDKQLRSLVDLDDRTRFHAHKGVAAFNRDWTSVTEGAALWRIEEREKGEGK
jgi:RNA polymerase sigma factor (sigma-70 family)